MSEDESPAAPLSQTLLDRELIFLFFAMSEFSRAIDALEEVSRLVSIREIDAERGIDRREWVRVFNSIRMALHYTGSVFRIFFPPKGKDERDKQSRTRGKWLRALTNLPFDHPIKNRALRDHVEHMDQRMDGWTSVSPRAFGGAIELIVHEDLRQITVDAIEASRPFIYYPAMDRVSVFGEIFSLGEMKDSLRDVGEHISGVVIQYHEDKEPAPQLTRAV